MVSNMLSNTEVDMLLRGKKHSVNKVNFTVVPFFMKSIVMDPFMSRNTFSMTFFTDHTALGTVYLPESQCVYSP